MSQSRFAGKVAVVTGSGQGIGETYARRLAAEGARVVIAELNAEKGRRVADEIGEAALFVETDVADEDSCIAMANAAAAAFGGIDCLVNNAAIYSGMRKQRLMDVDRDYYLRFMAVSLHGALFATRAVVPEMRKRGGGAIVNQSSIAAYMAIPGGGYYSVAKLGINGLTMSLAAELGFFNIRVNGIAPGVTRTEATAEVDPQIIEAMVAQTPLRRAGTTDEMADACLYLLSDEAGYVTGQTLCVDGGMIRRP